MAARNDRILELLGQTRANGASDLFLTAGKRPSVRIRGEVRPLEEAPVTAEELMEFLSGCLPACVLERLQHEHDLDVGVPLSTGVRYRLNVYHEKGRISAVARPVPSGALDLEALGLPSVLGRLAGAPRGLLLVTGPAGAGKSTTLAALVHEINRTLPRHIVTIEDPVEFVHEDLRSVISQREVGSDTPSFASALRQVVRQSPDVIVIGEMRDPETARAAVSAALTGHLVLTTMHTSDVAQSIERLLDMVPDENRERMASDLAASLVAIASQRLLPKADGTGLVPAHEVLVATPLVRKLIARRRLGEIPEILDAGGADGMHSFTGALAALARKGVITREAGLASAPSAEMFALAVDGLRTGVESARVPEHGRPLPDLTMRNLLRTTVRHGASDLILTAGKPPLLRIGGEIKELRLPELGAESVRRLFFTMLSPARRARFESRKEIDFALSSTSDGLEDGPGGSQHRFRVNGFWQRGAVGCVLRAIPAEIPTAEALGIPEAVMDLAVRRQGLILLTGPTGHGKSTTMACLIDRINATRACHIVTIEDPIEFVHPGRVAVIEQREVHADTRSFAEALRHVLRQAPDVIVVGELRDRESMATALTAAETGHLVLATLHTNDAAQTVDRVIDTFPPHHQQQVRAQLATCLLAVVSQRLLPRADGGGRTPAFEVLLSTPPIRAHIRDGRNHQIRGVIETSGRLGMTTLDASLRRLVDQGLVTRDAAAPWFTAPADPA